MILFLSADEAHDLVSILRVVAKVYLNENGQVAADLANKIDDEEDYNIKYGGQ